MSKYKPFLFLLFILIIAYWQISFLSFSLKWDVIDVVFPFRYHFSESIQSGNFPFWNPYQQTGTPFYADLQAPTYYPELLFISLISGYSIYTMHFLFILYVFIAAVGTYKLSFYFNKNNISSLIAGIAYALSGFVIGHGQHFFLLVGTAWIPFVILYYLKLIKYKKTIDVLKTGIVTFLLISGAYQALSFVMLYLLLTLFLYFILKEILKKNYKNIFLIIKLNIYLFIIILLFSLPLIISTFEVLSSVERLEEGISLEKALSNGLSLKSALSFLLPFPTLKNTIFFGSDASMRNFYFGVIPLIFFISALLKKQNILEYIFLIFGIIILTSAFNASLPIRELIFKYIPLMNLYKYAPFIRVFGILSLIIFSANYISQFQDNYTKEKQKVLIIGTSILIILVSIFIYSSLKIGFTNLSFLTKKDNFQELLNNITFHEHIIIQSTFQIFIIAIFLVLILKYHKIKYSLHLILLLFIFEIFVSAQLNMFYTVVDLKSKPYKMKNDLLLYPNKFPIPVNDKIIFNNKQHASFIPFWRNTYIFSKQISFNSFSSFKLKTYNKLNNDYPNLREAVLNNHLFYFSDKIFALSQFKDTLIKPKTCSKYLFFEDSVYNVLSKGKVLIDKEDKIKIVKFSPNKVSVKTNTKNNQYLTIIQSNYKGWKAFIDNKETKIYTSNFNYKTILLPKGKHIITYEYRNNIILITYLISNFLFLLSVLFLISYWLLERTNSKPLSIFASIIIFIILFTFTFVRLTYKDNNEHANIQISKKYYNLSPAIYIEENFETIKSKYDTITVFSGKRSFKIDSTTEYSCSFKINIEEETPKEGTLRFAAKVYPMEYNQTCIVSQLLRNNEQIEWHCNKLEKQIEHTYAWNNIQYLKNFYDLQKGDLIKIYIWNLGKSNLNIDDIKVEFYEF